MLTARTRLAKHRPLRFTLTVTITALIIAVSLSILAISYYGSARSLLVLSENMTAEVSKGIVEKINTVMNSAEKADAVVNLMIAQGSLDPTHGRRVMDVAAALVSQNEGFSSVEIGLPDGSHYRAAREADGSITRYSDVRTSTNVIRTYYYEHPDFPNQDKDSVLSLEKGYDARTRPWFVKAIGAGKTSWTDMFVGGRKKQFVYSCATPIYDKDRALIAVVGINIKLMTLSQFLGTLEILDHGRAIVMNDRDQVIAIPIKSEEELDRLFKPSPEGSQDPYQLYTVEEQPDQDIRIAILSYRRDRRRFFEFDGKGGEPIIASLVKDPYKGGSDFTVGIIFPKSDIMGSISRNTRLMLLGVLGFLLIAVLIGSHISRRISSSLAELCEEVDKVSRLELDSSRVVESRILEVVRIDEAVRNMKHGLQSFKKYVPVDLVLQLNALKKVAVLEGEKRELSIFFSDIANFTSISEQLTPEALVQRLGVYFSGMSRIVLDNAGTLDKYIGDAIMAFWGAPLPRGNHARLALKQA
jgi:adenylate cyclase